MKQNIVTQKDKNVVEKLPKSIQGVIQNRITLVSLILISIPCLDATLLPLAMLGCASFGGTGMGLPTNKIYQRTCTHIENFGKLDERFFQEIHGGYTSEKYYGYCELQGMYLACKKYGIENEFLLLRKKYSKNRIPNF